jgi:tetratricopeptide (TPR) repeat protein
LAAVSAEDYEQAVECFTAVLQADAEFYEAWYERGLALERWGYYAEAIASYDRALALNPNSKTVCDIWHDRGNVFQYGLGDYLQAIECYNEVLQRCPNHIQAYQNRGNALLYGLSRAEEALECYNKALAASPDDNLTWRNRGNALVELRSYEDAIISYDRALAINPDDQVAWHARNLAAERSGLNYRLPTTNPAWSGVGFGDPTLEEAETEIAHDIGRWQLTADDTNLVFPTYQSLLIIEDDWGRREMLLDRDCYTIGRDPKCDICLHSQYVSRQHAVLNRITRPDGTVLYQIVNGSLDGKPSTNGILVNGHKTGAQTLQADDMVVFGPKVQATYRLLPTA